MHGGGNGLSEYVYIYAGDGRNYCVCCFRSYGGSAAGNGYFRGLRSRSGDCSGRRSYQGYYPGNRAAGNVSGSAVYHCGNSDVLYCFCSDWKQELLEGGNRLVYDKVMLVMDTVGLGVFTVMGVDKGISQGYMGRTFFLVFLGTVTGVGGGLIRDMMAGVPPYIFVRHIYACASIVGAIACVWIYRLWGGVPAMVIGTVVVILIRYLAAHYRWNLPRLRRE